jgi:integrase
MSNRKHPSISQHQTESGILKVNWHCEYRGEYNCPYCEQKNIKSKLTWSFRSKSSLCQLRLGCNSCQKSVALTCQIPGVGRKHNPISQHQTVSGILKVNWNREYRGEYNCPECKKNKNEEHKLNNYHRNKDSVCKLVLFCKYCQKEISLTNCVPAPIARYRPKIECPNPLCTGIGHNGQKGWVYTKYSKYCKCHFCGITFNPKSTSPHSWLGSQTEETLSTFCFDNDVWELRHFYQKPSIKILNFQTIKPIWYREDVKKHLHYLLKSKKFNNESSIVSRAVTFRQFGQIVSNMGLKNKDQIDRNAVNLFLDSFLSNANSTINLKLSNLRDFFNWLDLEAKYLIRGRDFLKESKNDPDWLDEVSRKAIKQHLDKIPPPIARHYLVQVYTAARPGDVCQLSFDCLIEENGKWYIKFLTNKTKKWLSLPASREIRQVIEEQQQWIREVLGEDYSYLFCHFRSIKEKSYPVFEKIKPLPKPPLNDSGQNPMVRIIRMVIEKENIEDANGQKPDFISKITRPSKLQEVRTLFGIEAARLYAGHKSPNTTFQHYTPPTREQIAEVDLPFQELLLNPDNKFLPWQSLPEGLLKNPFAYELDLDIPPRLVVYGHCTKDPKTPCPVNLYPKCYGCSSFRPSTAKLSLYERQYKGEQLRLTEAQKAGAELASEEAQATTEAMDKWLPELRKLANG